MSETGIVWAMSGFSILLLIAGGFSCVEVLKQIRVLQESINQLCPDKRISGKSAGVGEKQ